jgi:hypothetical protein
MDAARAHHNPGWALGVQTQYTEGIPMNAMTAKLKMNGVLPMLGVLLVAMMLPLGGFAQASTATVPPGGAPSPEEPATDKAGCVLDHHTYTCNFGGFHHVFHHAKTISIEASPRDQASLTQLTELVGAINRTIAPTGQADLIFTVLPIDHGGVIIGPGDVDLATLRVYEQAPDGSRGELLWAETYRGQADRPWPATVHALIRQFQDRMARPHK